MSPEQRKAYNQRRYTPKNRKSGGESSNNNSSIKQESESFTEEGLDALTSIEQVRFKATFKSNSQFQEINRQTRQAQEVLKQQRGTPAPTLPNGSAQWPLTQQQSKTPQPATTQQSQQQSAQIIVQSSGQQDW
jgi:hypothetical protein